MIDENMVERVAEAIRGAVTGHLRKETAEAMARAAIEAMNLDTIPIVDMKDLG